LEEWSFPRFDGSWKAPDRSDRSILILGRGEQSDENHKKIAVFVGFFPLFSVELNVMYGQNELELSLERSSDRAD